MNWRGPIVRKIWVKLVLNNIKASLGRENEISSGQMVVLGSMFESSAEKVEFL